MGTRLYPQTSDPSALEKLINVPEGTYARLKDLQSAFDRTFGLTESYQPSYVKNPDANGEDVEYLFWQIINADLNLSKMDSFLTSGWEKFSQRKGDEALGEIQPGVDAERMLVSALNGEYFSSHMSPKETVELAGGLCRT